MSYCELGMLTVQSGLSEPRSGLRTGLGPDRYRTGPIRLIGPMIGPIGNDLQ
jgi:hypothetical protein